MWQPDGLTVTGSTFVVSNRTKRNNRGIPELQRWLELPF
jgi:hypothetical protein